MSFGGVCPAFLGLPQLRVHPDDVRAHVALAHRGVVGPLIGRADVGTQHTARMRRDRRVALTRYVCARQTLECEMRYLRHLECVRGRVQEGRNRLGVGEQCGQLPACTPVVRLRRVTRHRPRPLSPSPFLGLDQNATFPKGHERKMAARLQLAFLSAGLGALGLAALLLVSMGTYRPEKTKLMQQIKTLKHPAHLEQATRFLSSFP